VTKGTCDAMRNAFRAKETKRDQVLYLSLRPTAVDLSRWTTVDSALSGKILLGRNTKKLPPCEIKGNFRSA